MRDVAVTGSRGPVRVERLPGSSTRPHPEPARAPRRVDGRAVPAAMRPATRGLRPRLRVKWTFKLNYGEPAP
jgi:hypothetical protein